MEPDEIINPAEEILRGAIKTTNNEIDWEQEEFKKIMVSTERSLTRMKNLTSRRKSLEQALSLISAGPAQTMNDPY